jgi:MFS family permease
MSQSDPVSQGKAPSFRWVVLLVFAVNGMLSQIFWINFASINLNVAGYYGVSTTAVDLLSLMFMVVYLVVGPIASIIIDSRGFRMGAGLGAILTGGFGFLRYFASGPSNFALMVVFQIGVAAGQPFLYNAISKVAARWFPPGERATAAGIANLGFFVGILLGFILPPALLDLGFPTMMLIFGILGIIGVILFIIFGKDHPDVPYGDIAPIPWREVVGDLRKLLRMRIAMVLAIMSLVGVGVFNALSTFIQYISGVYPVSSDDAATLGGLVIIMGIIGAVILPAMSDKLFKAGKSYARKIFLVIGLFVSVPCSILIAAITDLTSMFVIMAIYGFFTLPTLAIGMQWIAEETAPIPESESNNLLMYAGQIGGIIFILSVPILFGTYPSPGIPQYSNAMFLFAGLYAIIATLLLVTRTRRSAKE